MFITTNNNNLIVFKHDFNGLQFDILKATIIRQIIMDKTIHIIEKIHLFSFFKNNKPVYSYS